MRKRSLQSVHRVFAVLILALLGVLPREADAANLVGTLSGKFSVTPAGVPTYSMPLDLPPGIGGVQPRLAITHVGGAPDSFMGPGFALSGLSQIARCPRTVADDGVAAGITGANDDFCLDGQRLVRGEQALDYRTQIESFQAISTSSNTTPPSFTVRTQSGLTMTYGGPGATYTGYTTSTFNTSGTNYVWLLSRVQDTAGNYMIFTYTFPGAGYGYYIDTIQYTGNDAAGVQPPVLVKFTYQQRSNLVSQGAALAPSGWVGGARYTWSQMLTQIAVSVSGQAPLRTWRLEYRSAQLSNWPYARLVLKSAQECGSDGTSCLPATLFDYAPASVTNTAVSGRTYATAVDSAIKLFAGDPHNNGFADVIGLKAPGDGRGIVTVFNNPGTGTGVNRQIWTLPEATTNAFPFVGDFNGDGYTDVAFVVDDGNCGAFLTYGLGNGTRIAAPKTMRLTAALDPTKCAPVDGDTNPPDPGDPGCLNCSSTNSAPSLQVDVEEFFGHLDMTQTQASASSDPLPAPHRTTEVQPGDFNGDGRQDVLLISNTADGYNIARVLATDTGFSVSQYSTPIAGSITSWKTAVGDLNGDGVSDLAVVGGAGPQVYTCLAAANCRNQGSLSGATMTSTGFSPFLVDMNGDGSQDLLMLKETKFTTASTSADAYVYFSNGLGNFAALSAPRNAFSFLSKDTYVLSFGDFDGDGFVDLAFSNTGSTTLNTLLYANNGAGVFGGFAITQTTMPSTGAAAVAGDFYGTGHSELAVVTAGTSTWLGLAQYAGLGNQRIAQITDGYGASVAVSYLPLTDSNVYDGSQDYSSQAFPFSHAAGDASLWAFPNHPLHVPLYVVSSVTVSGGGVSRSTARTYAGARVNVQGRGFLGFAEVTEADSATGMTEVTHVRQDFPYVGKTAHKLVTAGASRLNWTESTVSYALQSTGTSSQNPVAAHVEDRRYEIAVAGNPVVTTTVMDNTYSQYGELTYSLAKVYAGNSGSPMVFTTETANTYGADNVSLWLLGRLDSATVTRSNPDGSRLTRHSAFGYDTSTGLLISETLEPQDLAHWQETDYQRDGFGNIVQTTVKGPDVASRATTETFPAASPVFGRLSTRSCNALNHCTTRTYDLGGAMQTSTDPNGVTTSYGYDALGRSTGTGISQGAPGGLNISTTVVRQLCSAPGNLCNGVANGIFYIKTSQSDGSAAVEVYDSAERLVRKAATIGDGSWVETLAQYDAAGRPAKASSPRFATASASNTFWTTTAYDDAGRPLTITAPKDQNTPTGSVTSYTYNGLATTITNPRGFPATRVLDALGRLVLSTDANNASVSYMYDTVGNLVRTTDAANHVTTLTYDIRGRKVEMTDPDMGTWQYTVNTLGEVVSQVDANGNTVSMQYDLLGRMTRRVEPEDSATWAYDTAWKGALYQATVTSGGSERYRRTLTDVTAFGAPQTEAIVIDGNSYTTTYAYDNQGRRTLVNYPANFSTALRYNASGAQDLVYEPGNTAHYYWRADAWDESGKVYLETYGNTVQTMSSRDVAVGRLATLIAGPGGSSAVQSATYSWDANGNLLSRQDAASGVADTFQYDAVDRLTHATQSLGGVAATLDIAYDALGNITSKSDVGAYSYSTPKPHAVSGAGGNAYQYDANGNLTRVTGTLDRTYTWASYNLPVSLAATAGGSTLFEYGPGREKVRQTTMGGGMPATVDFVGGIFEALMQGSSVTYKNYIVAPTGAIAVVSQALGQPLQFTYFHHDNLGSVVALTDASGSVIQRIGFDAFGQRRVSGGGAPQTPWGYTGHLSLDDLNLVHMNGRVYDPALGRFITADPFVQAPGNLQSLNRYSYVWNNPLTFVDGNGYSFNSDDWRMFASVLISAVTMYVCGNVGAGYAGLVAAAGGFASGYVMSHGDLTAAFIGAGFSFLSLSGGEATEGAMAASFYEGYVLGVAVHGVIGVMQAGTYGRKVGEGFVGGALPAAAAPLVDGGTPIMVGDVDVGRVVATAAVSGTASEMGGGKFSSGAATAAFLTLFGELERHVTRETDRLKLLACASGGRACVRDERGVLRTDGARDPDWTYNRSHAHNAWTDSGMADEGSGGHWYDKSDALAYRLARFFVTDVSKIHDWFNSWNYSSDNGFYLSRGIGFDSTFQIYSFLGMPVAGAATVMGIAGNAPMAQQTYYYSALGAAR